MEAKEIQITVEVARDHDWCKLRRFLKALLRSYGLKCIAVETVQDSQAEQAIATEQGRDTPPMGKCSVG